MSECVFPSSSSPHPAGKPQKKKKKAKAPEELRRSRSPGTRPPPLSFRGPSVGFPAPSAAHRERRRGNLRPSSRSSGRDFCPLPDSLPPRPQLPSLPAQSCSGPISQKPITQRFQRAPPTSPPPPPPPLPPIGQPGERFDSVYLPPSTPKGLFLHERCVYKPKAWPILPLPPHASCYSWRLAAPI